MQPRAFAVVLHQCWCSSMVHLDLCVVSHMICQMSRLDYPQELHMVCLVSSLVSHPEYLLLHTLSSIHCGTWCPFLSKGYVFVIMRRV